jgi:ribosomal 30S subunit maturation factor RimM
VNLLEVGRIDKPHGVRGDVVVALTTTEKGRVAPGTRLFSGDREFLITDFKPIDERALKRRRGEVLKMLV